MQQIVDLDAEMLVRHFCLEAECAQVLEWLKEQGHTRPDEFEERITLAGKLRELGNKRYEASDFRGAMMHALGALHSIDFSQARIMLQNDDQKQRVIKALLPILSNLSIVFLKQGDAYNSVRAADLGLERAARLKADPEAERLRAKLLFRRGLAKGQRKDFAEARVDLVEAAKLMPDNREVRRALENCKAALQKDRGAPDDKWRGLLTEAPRTSRMYARALRYARTARALGKELLSALKRPEGLRALAMLVLGPLLSYGLHKAVYSWAQSREAR